MYIEERLPNHFRHLEKKFIYHILRYNHGIIINSKDRKVIQNGGGKERIYKYEDIGGIYSIRVYVTKDNKNNTTIHVLSEDDTDCVTVFINNNDNKSNIK